MCGPVDIGCQIGQGLHDAVETGFAATARLIGEAAMEGLHSLATFWVKYEAPTLATGSGDEWTDSSTVGFLRDQVRSVSAAIFTLAILVAGIRIAWEQRAEPLRQLLKTTILFVVVSAAGTATLQLLASWADAFAVSLVQESLPENQSFDTAVGNVILAGIMTNQSTANLPLSITLWLCLAVFAASVIQVVLLLIRSAMLVLLAGTFPLAAAATNTELGKTWFTKYCGWSIAFIAYKPAAALIYAAAFRMSQDSLSGQSGDTLVQVLTGVMMLLLAIFALPALLRFAVPITAAVAASTSGMTSSLTTRTHLASGAITTARSHTTPTGSTPTPPTTRPAAGPSTSGSTPTRPTTPSASTTPSTTSHPATPRPTSPGAPSPGSATSPSTAASAGASAALATAGATITTAQKATTALTTATTHSAGDPTAIPAAEGPAGST